MLRHRQQRSTPILQKEASQEVQDKFNKVEALVADVLSSTNGSATSSAAVAVESACRRARQKSKMMPSLGSGLVLAALDVSFTSFFFNTIMHFTDFEISIWYSLTVLILTLSVFTLYSRRK